MDAFDAILETVAGRFDAIDTDSPAKVGSPTNCPLDQLPHLAWSRGLDYWDPAWPESTKRQLTRNAPANRRIRGTKQAIQNAVQAFTGDVVITEWWEEAPQGASMTATANVALGTDLGGSAEDQAVVSTILEREGRKSVLWTILLGVGGDAPTKTRSHGRLLTMLQDSGEQIGA